jgi:hypothetical protein
MNNLKNDLIRLGNNNPELREHLRPVLDQLESPERSEGRREARRKTAMAGNLRKHMSEYSHQLSKQAVGFFERTFPDAEVDYMGKGSPGLWVEDIIIDFFTSSTKTKPQVVVKLVRDGERSPVFEETFDAKKSYRDIFASLRVEVELYSEVL